MSRRAYEVVEYRGCDIEYSVFQGTYQECSQWLKNNCWQDIDFMGDLNWVKKVNNDPSCVNGNGFAFQYTIREVTNGVEA